MIYSSFEAQGRHHHKFEIEPRDKGLMSLSGIFFKKMLWIYCTLKAFFDMVTL